MNNEIKTETTKNPRRKLFTLKQKMAIVKQIDTSGLSIKDLAAYYGIIPNTLRVWHKRLSKNRTPKTKTLPEFVKQMAEMNANEPQSVTPEPAKAETLAEQQEKPAEVKTVELEKILEEINKRLNDTIEKENNYTIEIERLHTENNRLRVALNALLSN